MKWRCSTPYPPWPLRDWRYPPIQSLLSSFRGFYRDFFPTRVSHFVLKSALRVMANITILSRSNVVEFIKANDATKLDFVKNPHTQKMFFALNDAKGTKGAISKSLQEEIASGKQLSISEVIVADTVMEGSTNHCLLLMKAGESNTLGGFSL